MPTKEDFIKDGFIVEENKINENKLIKFLKENYPQVIKDNEIKLNELQEIIGLPIDEKLNGYGLNFIGRQVAKAIYKQQTDKVLKINNQFSKQFDTTQNMVIKGDNIDSLKILKNYYSGKIKCIYIDPPYNTDSEQFIYKDNFKKEELEVLGLSNISQEEKERLEFSFKTPKSHNGWLTFMYPRLKLAYDLLTDDGVIFISIDEHEIENLLLLCNDIFGEDNFIENFIWIKNATKNLSKTTSTNHEYILCYSKNKKQIEKNNIFRIEKPGLKEVRKILEEAQKEKLSIEETQKKLKDFYKNNPDLKGISTYNNVKIKDKIYQVYTLSDISAPKSAGKADTYQVLHPITNKPVKIPSRGWAFKQDTMNKMITDDLIEFYDDEKYVPRMKRFLDTVKTEVIKSTFEDFTDGKKELLKLFNSENPFSNPKPTTLIKKFIRLLDKNSIILDFFAGSGTTGHAVMQLNAEDGGNRKFILCQLDEEIKEDKNKEAFDFCKENNFPSVISSITCERLNRAGEKIKSEFATKAKDLDVGYKVFDLVQGEKLILEQEELKIENQNNLNPIDKIYNLIFKVGIDNPQMQPKEIIKDCMYLCDNGNNKNYYIVNSKILDTTENKKIFKQAIDTGNIYIDGWTATINTTLQEKKDNIKIIF